MASEIKQQVEQQIKDAMRARDKERLAALRLVTAEFKRVEVDERIDLDDERVLAILDKMVKQRKDSLAQYEQANRGDLAGKEAREIDIIREFMPQPLTDDELGGLVEAAIAEVGATGMKEMGRVMQILKPRVQGRADMGTVSNKVKQTLSSS